MSEILIHKKQSNSVCHIELNMPNKRNVLSMEMISNLTDQFQNLKKDPNIQLLILSGKGEHFCAGGDLRWMNLDPDMSDTENINQVSQLAKMFYALESLPCPVICRIKGSVFGGGLGLVAASDIVVAQELTQFCFSEVKLALVPSLISPFLLKKIQKSKLKELCLSARIFETQEAKDLGLIHFSGSSEDCDNYTSNLVLKLLKYDKQALQKTKELLDKLPQLSYEEQKESSIQTLANRRKSPEVRKHISRFFKSRELKKTQNK